MSRTLFFILLALIVLPIGVFYDQAQSAEQAEPTREQLQIQISILLDRIKAVETANTQLRQQVDIDPGLRSAYVDAKKKEYQFIARVMEENIQAYDAQWWASYAILFLVIMVVVSGISFAGFQLWKSISIAGVQTSNDIELSAAKVRVTSSVVGIVVLAISLAFLYIYTQQVYQMVTIQPSSSSSAR
jgi:hypothetical protein